MELSNEVVHDLALSGLVPRDIRARNLDMTERASCGLAPQVEGYVIPYYNIAGRPLPFYRTKLFNHEIKYKQIRDTANHVYFPPTFLECLHASDKTYIIITEGEKKAACATKLGFPTIAFGGVDSWRSKILLLPADTEFVKSAYSSKLLGARLPSSMIDIPEVNTELVAVGFPELANMALKYELSLLIVYDSDETTALTGMKHEVQRAAAELGFEFRRRGIPLVRIRQLILPMIPEADKVGIDDFLVIQENGVQYLHELIQATMAKRSAFPQHPNMQDNLNKKLQAQKLTRKDIQKLALTLITDLDSRGVRMFSKDEQQLYYFDETLSKLIKVELSTSGERGIQTTAFSKMMYVRYGIAMSSDVRLMKWFSTQFAAEEPVVNVRPFRVLARSSTTDDCVRYQLNDGHYAKITGNPDKPLEILINSSESILFESEQVEPISVKELVTEFKKRQQEPLTMWWEDVLQEVRLKDHGKVATIVALLYYMSPWLHRWRGTQLPVELVIGEAGSGKFGTLNSLVLTANGWKRMGDMHIGDIVITPDGTLTPVIAIHPQGVKNIWKVTMTDGASTLCGKEHLWQVQSLNDKTHENRFNKGLHPSRARPLTTLEKTKRHKWTFHKVKSLGTIMDGELRYGGQAKTKFKNYIPIVKSTARDAIQSEILELDPYALGLLLGDGSFRQSYTIGFTSMDSELVDALRLSLKTFASVIELVFVFQKSKACMYRTTSTRTLRKYLISLDLWDKLSTEKHIPDIYLEGKADQRLALLQGLMDTDGTLGNASNSPVFNTSSKQLAHNVQQLVWSLGGTAIISLRTAPLKKGHNLAYNICIRLPLDMCPFRLTRKVTKFKSVRHQVPIRAISKIEYYGKEEAQCITLADPRGLYITDDYIVTHNSTLCELRLLILTGQANLRNAPADFKDWHASIANTGGLHVTDNVQLVDKSLKQRLSDGLCRLITEPEPHIEMRKLYSDLDLMHARVDAVFCFTAITQPFQQSDLLQRAFKIELDKMTKKSALTDKGSISYDSSWRARQLERFGGRTAWVSHHLYVLHRFLQKVGTEWRNDYQAKHRLINLEQSMMLMADIFGLDNSWIPDFLASQTDSSIIEADWMLEGISTFCSHVRARGAKFALSIGGDKRTVQELRFSAKNIADWASTDEDYNECYGLINSRRLGRYLQTHKALLAQTAGLLTDGSRCNKILYKVKNK